MKHELSSYNCSGAGGEVLLLEKATERAVPVTMNKPVAVGDMYTDTFTGGQV